MALCRMYKLSDLCISRNPFVKSPLNENLLPKKHVRHFKRERLPEKPTNISNIEHFHVTTDVGSLNGPNLLKSFCFTIGFSGACFIGATIWEYEEMRSHATAMLKRPIKMFKRKVDEYNAKSRNVFNEIGAKWRSLPTHEKVFVPICALNVLIFGAWKIPRLQPFMLKYFCSNPASKNICLPMLLSTFSHYSGFHLFANMYVLHSFSAGAVQSLGKEQFMGLYLSAGVVSSFTSYLYKVATKQPGLSLGASGAIMAVLGYVCTQYPDTKLGVILLPVVTFSAGAGLKAIMALDLAGVIMKWRFFDHAAHLGGATCGILWALWGNQHLWKNREPILQYWHELRGSIK